ncbi:hypothetical protein [Companilactobacillus paralimentarius]|uniref:hypothetical protein n=1 Tax=Companilactobacillus paralimentarius TaxID=83526 RepID=UPI00046945FB|nr:hypothetical protein [Companilactobacillus paralimentarius]KAE9563271.1 hypothetical protein ATN96_11155 [Companilactobacillus paralimentarius]
MIRSTIYLIKSNNQKNSDPLNHVKPLIATKYYGARITSLNGSQEQINVIGKQYDKSWVIRLNCPETADYVAFEGEYDEKQQSPKYAVKQLRTHRNRTTIYAVGTVVKS